MEMVCSGFGTVESPTIDDDGTLYFSDIPRGGVYRVKPGGQPEVSIPRRKGVGGMCRHQDGGLVVSGRDISHVRDGLSRVIYRPTDIPPREGEPAGGFNDIAAGPDGCVYAGSVRGRGSLNPCELLRIDGEGSATVLYDDVVGTNGIGFSPDGGRIYHSNSRRQEIVVYDFDGPRTHVSGRFSTAAVEGTPDGLDIDADGFIWVAFYTGGCVVRWTPAGKVDEVVSVPARLVTCARFSRDGTNTLYITTEDNTEEPAREGCIFRMDATVAGAPIYRATV